MMMTPHYYNIRLLCNPRSNGSTYTVPCLIRDLSFSATTLGRIHLPIPHPPPSLPPPSRAAAELVVVCSDYLPLVSAADARRRSGLAVAQRPKIWWKSEGGPFRPPVLDDGQAWLLHNFQNSGGNVREFSGSRVVEATTVKLKPSSKIPPRYENISHTEPPVGVPSCGATMGPAVRPKGCWYLESHNLWSGRVHLLCRALWSSGS